MRFRGFVIAVAATVLSASGAEAKRGFSLKGLWGSSKSAPAPTPAAAPKPAAAPVAPPQAAAPKPPAPAAAPTAAAPNPAAPAAAPRGGSFIFVSTGRSGQAAAEEKKNPNKQSLETLPVTDTTATVNESGGSLIKPAGYKAPVMGATQPASSGSVPGFKLIN